jgi:hypothetical protein
MSKPTNPCSELAYCRCQSFFVFPLSPEFSPDCDVFTRIGTNDWITINYKRNTLFDPDNSVGILDLGGASCEITLDIRGQDAMANFFPLRLRGDTISLYSHSFLQFGARVAYERLLQIVGHDWNPCHGDTASFTHCYALAAKLLHKNEPCWTQFDSCSFVGVYQPDLTLRSFVAIGNFATTVRHRLQLPVDASVAEIGSAAAHLCKQGSRSCFEGVWVYTLLANGFQFAPNARQIAFVAEGADSAIGAIIYEANQLPWMPGPTDGRPVVIEQPYGVLMSWHFFVFCGAFGMLLIGTLIAALAVIAILASKLRAGLRWIGWTRAS